MIDIYYIIFGVSFAALLIYCEKIVREIFW